MERKLTERSGKKIFFNVVDLFQQQVKIFPDRTAISYGNKKISFKDFGKSIDETAQYFLHKGIKKGDRVLVFVPMSDSLYRVVLALFKIGATAVFLDEWVSVKRLNICCQLADCQAFVGSGKARLLAWFIPGLRSIPLRLGLSYESVQRTLPFPETTHNDVALITFTTGSTGTPKAAIRTHGLLREQFAALRPVIDPQPGEVGMATLPGGLTGGLPVGKPEAAATVKIIQFTNEPIAVSTQTELEKLEKPPRTIGEIIVSGKHVLRDYWRNEEAMRRNKIFIGEQCWHRTGDSGFLDESGALFLTGRCNTLIYQEGKVISPFMFEAIFQEIDGVGAGTILAVGGRIIAVIEPVKKSGRELLRERITSNAQGFDQVVFLKKLPRDPRHYSKIDYELLKGRVASQLR